jgi:hypothetical protein
VSRAGILLSGSHESGRDPSVHSGRDTDGCVVNRTNEAKRLVRLLCVALSLNVRGSGN